MFFGNESVFLFRGHEDERRSVCRSYIARRRSAGVNVMFSTQYLARRLRRISVRKDRK